MNVLSLRIVMGLGIVAVWYNNPQDRLHPQFQQVKPSHTNVTAATPTL
jgi:hypothetical protein